MMIGEPRTIRWGKPTLRDFGTFPDKAKYELAAAMAVAAAADFSWVRRAKLTRFTIDRLMTMLARLGQEVDVSVVVRPSRSAPPGGSAGSHPSA